METIRKKLTIGGIAPCAVNERKIASCLEFANGRMHAGGLPRIFAGNRRATRGRETLKLRSREVGAFFEGTYKKAVVTTVWVILYIHIIHIYAHIMDIYVYTYI